MSPPQPAYLTKHIQLLSYPIASSLFSLRQSDNGLANGTALWLGGQCLASYLSHRPISRTTTSAPRALELGSGIGLTALTLSARGWDVLATDTKYVISSVLSSNIQNNIPLLPPDSGKIQVRELDWTVQPKDWVWNHKTAITSQDLSLDGSADTLSPPFDLICSADTIYIPTLIEPLLRTLHSLSTLSILASTSSRAPIIFICLERRDPSLVDRFLTEAANAWQFNVERIPPKKLSKALTKSGVQWKQTDWEGVELWKLKLIH